MFKALIKIICIALIVLSIPVSTQAAEVMKPLIVIDPGHGGKYGGTTGYSGSKTGYYEKQANLEVSLRLRDVLQARGYEVKMTRTTDKHFSNTSSAEDLKARTSLSNSMVAGRNDNSIFVSVHHNASSSPTYSGYETYYYNKDFQDSDYPADPLQLKYSIESGRLAHTTQTSVINSGANTEGRGIVHRSLFVTRNAQVPAILSEVEYMSNPIAESKVKTAKFQQGIAVALADGVDKFFKIFEVKNSKNVVIKQFTTKDQAITYAKTQTNVTVFDKRAGTTIFDNTTTDYRVYHPTVELTQTKFSTEKEAITFASKYRNTRVVHHPTAEVRWSNYIAKKFDILDANKVVIDQHYQRVVAETSAESLAKATLQNSETNSTLWSSIVPQAFEVRHKDNGTLKAFYDKTLAQNYAALWPGTTVYDTSKKVVVYTNPTLITPKAVSKTISAESRYLTAIEVSKTLYPNAFNSTKPQKTVVLATAFEYADALSAGPLAMYYDNAPILLNPASNLNADVLAEIKRLGANHIVLVGGEVALSAKVASQLQTALPQAKVERLAGKSRYETNSVINNKLPNANGIFIASGSNFPDALAATSIAVTQGWHIVLSNGTTYSDAINDQVYSKPTVIVGGTLAISKILEEKIKVRAGSDYVTRLSGKDRYGTNAALIEHFSPTFKSPTFIVSTGTNYPDALVSSSLSGKYQAPLFLVGNSISETLRPTLTSYLAQRVTKTSLYTGGIVPTAVKTEIDQLK
ncbi:cell wall-binding repeat-containing protein [Paenisporosarcina sp. TG-14]|uniref:cell wall-binding repeat-containing protein n=1 Tax=Paenisporosarcina sp. TG-14 TaxID=1231057 RepID=UPI0002F2BBA6|nr:cell wall-binding repeat-containing protein [Paenisporosarcina sp. TG-14]